MMEMTCKQKDGLIAELKHRLGMISGDVEVISRHITNNCNESFKQPSYDIGGHIFAEEAWHNISNIEIACDLNSDESLDWGVKPNHLKPNKDK